MSRRWRFFLLFALVGCGENAGITSVPAGAHRMAAPAVEPGWNSQIAAVRAGESEAIRIGAEAAKNVVWSDLATGCEELRSVWIEEARPSAADLEQIASLEKLEALTLTTPIDDEELALISECRSLKRLNLPNGTFGDEGLMRLAKLARLEQLRIGAPGMTDRGLKSLREFPRLRFLHLIDVPVTDEGLRHVAAVTTLESFYLDGGAASEPGLRDLLSRRPDLHFHKDQLHLRGDPQAHP